MGCWFNFYSVTQQDLTTFIARKKGKFAWRIHILMGQGDIKSGTVACQRLNRDAVFTFGTKYGNRCNGTKFAGCSILSVSHIMLPMEFAICW